MTVDFLSEPAHGAKPPPSRWDQFLTWANALDPIDVERIESVHVDHDGITVYRFQVDARGTRAVVPNTQQVLSTIEEIKFYGY
jgi:hypothetical protein